MVLNEYGRIVEYELNRTMNIRPNVEIDVYSVMPNHFHGILVINSMVNSRRGVLQYAPTNTALRSPSQTVGAIIRGFKSTITKCINAIRNSPGVTVWQRNYYEHIIRDENEMHKIREYIVNNPLNWAEDENFK